MNNRFTLFYKALFGAAVLTAASFSAHAQGVGVGTTAPDASAALDVVASNKGALLPRMTAAGRTGILSPATGLIVFQTDGTPGFYYNSGTTTPVWQQIATAAGTSTGFIQNQNAADQVANFRISGSGSTLGNFGVGTSAPQLGLDVANGSSSIGLRNNAAWDHIYWLHDGATAYMRAGGADFGLALQVGISNTGTYGDVSQAYRDVMRLLQNGNVGIGTTTPAAKLTVQLAADADQGLRVTDGTTTGNIVIQPLTGGNTGFSTINYNGYYGTAGETRFNTTKNRWRAGTDQRSTSDLFFIDTYNGTTLSIPLAITAASNVGIGTTTPQQRLDVSGSLSTATVGTLPLLRLTRPDNYNVKFANSLELALGSYGTNNSSQSQVNFNLANGYTDNPDVTVMSLQASGNVGIGTTTPAAKLTVQLAADVDQGLRVTDGTTTGNIVIQPLTGGNTGFSTINYNGYFGTAGETRFNTTKNRWRAGTDQRGTSDLFLIDTYNGTTSSIPLAITAAGNVGIGTTAPAEKLDVAGNIQSSTNIAVDYNNANAGTVANSLHFGPTNSGEAIGSTRTAGGNRYGLDFYTASINRMAITPTGNVGIGTTAPAEKLDVVGNIQSSANIAVDYGNANAGTVTNTLRFGSTNSGEAIGSTRTAGGNRYGLDFYTASINRMAITPTGNVGIGTTTPATKLDVNGNFRLTVHTMPSNLITVPYTLVATDIAFSIFRLTDGAFTTSIILPAAGVGQVAGQELTIYNVAAANSCSISGTNTDNTLIAVVLQARNVGGTHAVKYIWDADFSMWIRVQ